MRNQKRFLDIIIVKGEIKMNILVAIVIVILGFLAILFGSAAAVMIGKDSNEKKLRKQNELLNELEALREEYYEDNNKLNERITTLSMNQQYLERNIENILNKGYNKKERLK